MQPHPISSHHPIVPSSHLPRKEPPCEPRFGRQLVDGTKLKQPDNHALSTFGPVITIKARSYVRKTPFISQGNACQTIWSVSPAVDQGATQHLRPARRADSCTYRTAVTGQLRLPPVAAGQESHVRPRFYSGDHRLLTHHLPVTLHINPSRSSLPKSVLSRISGG